jgi:hypothetical protein
MKRLILHLARIHDQRLKRAALAAVREYEYQAKCANLLQGTPLSTHADNATTKARRRYDRAVRRLERWQDWTHPPAQ